MTSLVTDYLNNNNHDGYIDFYQIDTTSKGGSVYYVTPQATASGTITFAGTSYTCIPCAMSKSKMSTTGTLPQPQFSIAATSNPLIRAAINSLGTLAGCKITKFSTFEKYLDAVNTTRINGLNYSQDVSQANWAKNNLTLTSNAIAAPDGTLTADLLMDTVTNAQHYVSVNSTVAVVAGDLINVSVCVKDNGAEYVLVYVPNVTALGGGVVVRLSDGVITSYNTPTGVFNAVTKDIGNGWWNISFSTYAASTTATLRVFCNPSGSSNAPAYAGDGTKGFYIWGAQIQRPTTSTIDASTMTATNATIALNSGGTLDPIGTNTADIIADTAVNNTHSASKIIAGFSQEQEVFYTVHLKAGSVITQAMVRFLSGTALATTAYCIVDLNTGVVTTTSNLSRTPTVTAMANGFWRITISAITTSAGSMYPTVMLVKAGTNTYLGTGAGIYYWNGHLTWDREQQPYQLTTTTHAPYADPLAISPVETYIISQMLDMNKETITWKLTTPLDRPNLFIPRLQYLKDDIGETATPQRCVYAPGLNRVME